MMDYEEGSFQEYSTHSDAIFHLLLSRSYYSTTATKTNYCAENVKYKAWKLILTKGMRNAQQQITHNMT